MKLETSRIYSNIKLFLITTLIIVVSFAIYSVYVVEKTLNDTIEVAYSQKIIADLNDLIARALDAETATRGYLLTHKKDYLYPLDGSKEDISDLLLSITKHVGKEKNQQTSIDSISKLISYRFEAIDLLLNLDSSGASRTPLFYKLLDEGKKTMDELREQVSIMEAQEAVILNDRLFAYNQASSNPTIVFTVFSMITILIIIITFYQVLMQFEKRARAEHMSKSLINELKRSNQDLEQFAYVASHDLQEPLRKIRAFGDRLVGIYEDATEPIPGAEYVKRMGSAAERMQTLINDLLTFSRISREKAPLKMIDLRNPVEEAVSNLALIINEKKATVNVRPLPNEINGNHGQLTRLFQNLISNGIKFQAEGITPIIEISYKEVSKQELKKKASINLQQNCYEISVADNGIGFDEKYLDKIFTLFQRLHGRSEYEGTGIGLAVCAKIVSNHHGYLTAESEEGKGATFLIYLPKI